MSQTYCFQQHFKPQTLVVARPVVKQQQNITDCRRFRAEENLQTEGNLFHAFLISLFLICVHCLMSLTTVHCYCPANVTHEESIIWLQSIIWSVIVNLSKGTETTECFQFLYLCKYLDYFLKKLKWTLCIRILAQIRIQNEFYNDYRTWSLESVKAL